MTPILELVAGKRLLYRQLTGTTEAQCVGIARATKGDLTLPRKILRNLAENFIWSDCCKTQVGKVFLNQVRALLQRVHEAVQQGFDCLIGPRLRIRPLTSTPPAVRRRHASAGGRALFPSQPQTTPKSTRISSLAPVPIRTFTLNRYVSTFTVSDDLEHQRKIVRLHCVVRHFQCVEWISLSLAYAHAPRQSQECVQPVEIQISH